MYPLLGIIFIMKKNELMIKKPSAMIQTNVKGLSLLQRKAINSLIHIAQSSGEHNIYKVPIATLKKMCGITTVGNDDIKEQLRTLTDIKIEYNILNKDDEIWEVNVLLAGAVIKPHSGEIQFAFSPFLLKRILNPAIYAPLSIVMTSGFNSTYTLILYEFLRDYLFSPKVPRLTIVEFKDLMGVENNKYKLFKNFRNRVLNNAVNEINIKSDITCSYDLIKNNGNKYSHIQFSVKSSKQSNQTIQLEFTTIPQHIINTIPVENCITTVFDIIRPYYQKKCTEEFLISNIEYTNKNHTSNYPAYLKLSFENDYAKPFREIEKKKKTIKQEKKKNIQEKKNQEKELKQKAWNYFASLPERVQVEFKSVAEEKMNAALKIIKIPERRDDIINAQIEKDLIAELNQGREL